MKYQTWRPDALNDVQRMINRTLHTFPRWQAGGRGRTTGSPGTGGIRHPFQVTVSGEKCRIAGGYVIGYDEARYVPDQELPVAAGMFYIAVTPNAIDRVISVEIISSGKKYYRENGVYYFPLAEWKKTEDGTRTLIQHQFGNLVTPFRRNYIPIIEASLQCLLTLEEGEGDEIKFCLQDDVALGGPLRYQHLCTNKKNELYWHDCDYDDSSSSSSSGSSSSSSENDSDNDSSNGSSSSGDTVDDLIPGKWYVFVRYQRDDQWRDGEHAGGIPYRRLGH